MKHDVQKTMNQENMDYVLDEKMKIVNTLNHAFLALFYIDIQNNTIREVISLDNSLILSISLDTFSTQNPKLLENQHFEMEQIYMERSGMYICSISGAARSGG